MGFVDREVKIRPNANPGYLDASLIVKTNKTSLEGINEESKAKVFKEARKWADEEIENNKNKLRDHLTARQAVLKQHKITKRDKETKSVVRRSKVVADVSRYGNEWKSVSQMDSNLEKCSNEAEKRKALATQIRYHKVVLNTDKLFDKSKAYLFKIGQLKLDQLRLNMQEIIESSPHYEYLADVAERETTRITGATILNKAERKKMYDERVMILKNKLEVERRKRKKMTLKEKIVEEESEVRGVAESSDFEMEIVKDKESAKRKEKQNTGGKRKDTINSEAMSAKRKYKHKKIPDPEFSLGKKGRA